MKNLFNKIARRFFKFSQWIHYEQWQDLGNTLKDFVATPFVTQSLGRIRTFEDITQELQLSEAELLERKQFFQKLVWFWLGILGFSGIYITYLVMHSAWLNVLYVSALSLIILCQAFRYHFWAFQIEERRLGCSIQEWWEIKIKRKNKV